MDLFGVACVGYRCLFSFARRDNLREVSAVPTSVAGADEMMIANRSGTGPKIAGTHRGAIHRTVAIPKEFGQTLQVRAIVFLTCSRSRSVDAVRRGFGTVSTDPVTTCWTRMMLTRSQPIDGPVVGGTSGAKRNAVLGPRVAAGRVDGLHSLR